MPTKRNRYVPDMHKKIVCLLSYNQCAFPGCSVEIAGPPDPESPILGLRGDICHIVSPSARGPRPNSGLTSEQLNHHDNLILLCNNHHREIDKVNPDKYTTEVLKEMKRTHQTAVRDQVIKNSQTIPIEAFSDSQFPVDIIDHHVEDYIRKIYQKSCYNEFDESPQIADLFDELTTGRLSYATRAVRSMAMATLALIFERRQEHDRALEAVDSALMLAHTERASLAKTLIGGTDSTKASSLQKLHATATPAARTTALLLTAKVSGCLAALDWYTNSGLRTEDLDPEGQLALCTMLLRESHWNQAIESASEINPTAITAMPALNHTVAMANLVMALPAEYRCHFVNGMPLNARYYPLIDKPKAMVYRRTAIQHFLAAATAAKLLDLPATRANEERYAIWLQLMDVETEDSGQQLLRERLQPLASALPFMQLGIEFEILDDLSSVRRELARQRVLNGGETAYSAAASISILMRIGDPAKLSTYIETRFDELSRYMEPSSLIRARLLALSAAGNAQHASAILSQLPADMLSRADRDEIEALIASDSEGTDLQILKSQFESHPSAHNLQALVYFLDSTERWTELCHYGRSLFDQAPTATVATSLAYAYYQTNQPELIIDLVLEEVSFLSMSPRLRLLYCWALHSTGDFREARMQLKYVPINLDERAYRLLRRNLDISTGYWDNLPMFIQGEIEQIETRSPSELVDTARLAAGIKSSHSISFIRAAAQKGSDDPEVLVACNSLATRLGFEGSNDVSEWFFRAVELSQADGPLKVLSSDEMIAYRETWADTQIHIHRLLAAAEIPIFLAAHRLGRCLLDDTLIRAMRNENTDDIRDRFPVPAYCSNRDVPGYDDVQILGIDATAVLNLAFLGILEDTIDSFDKILVSSSMLEWLFDEHTRSTIQQPGLLEHASQLVSLSETAKIDFIDRRTNVPQTLIDEIGHDVATLICEAQSNSADTAVPHLVVHPAPSPLDDIDGSRTNALEGCRSVLTSCSSVVTWLAECGQLLQKEISGALAFLAANEEPWPRPVRIAQGNHLYLSALTILYLQRLRILHKLPRSGVTVHASTASLDEARWTISHAQLLDTTARHVESIRSAIVSRIDSGRVSFAGRTMIAESEAERLVRHPSIDLAAISEGADAIVCDDRFCNKYSAARRSPKQVPIITTLNLLDILVQRQRLSSEDRDSHRTRLRQAGFIFIPVTEDEIVRFLRASQCKDGTVTESAELRAIRDNLYVVRMRGWFEPPVDHGWMDSLFTAVATALPKLWNGELSVPVATAYSSWLKGQFNVRHYGHFFHGHDAFAQMRSYEADFASEVLRTAQHLTPARLVEFLAWFDESMLKPLRWIDEDSYGLVLERQMAWIEEASGRVHRDHGTRGSDDGSFDVADVASVLLNRVPRSVRDALLDDGDFVARYQLADQAVMHLHDSSVRAYSSSLISSLRRLFTESNAIPVHTPGGQACVVQFSNDAPDVPVLCQDGKSVMLREFLMFSPDSAARGRCFDAAAGHFGLSQTQRRPWKELLLERVPSVHEFDAIIRDLRDSPARVELSIIESLQKGQLSVELVAPISPLYYSRLIGSRDGSSTIDDFIQEGLGTRLEQHVEAVDRTGLGRCLLVAFHSAVVERIPASDGVTRALRSVLGHTGSSLDLTSQVAAIELALRMLGSIPDVGSSVGSLIKSVINDDVDSRSSQCAVFCYLFIIVDMRLAATRALAHEPPFYRRAAALTQAALVQSILSQYQVPSDSLTKFLNMPDVIFHRVQSLIDMRLEPRWHPRYASPDHFKASACARIRLALDRTEDRIGEARLQQLIGSDVIAHVRSHPRSFLKSPPSPIQGRVRDMPDATVDALGPVGPGSPGSALGGAGLDDVIYQSLYSKTDRDILGDLRRGLDLFGNDADGGDVDSVNLVPQLELLATAAGATRDSKSTDRIHAVLLQLLRDQGRNIDFGIACDIGIAACSSSSDYDAWRSRVTTWLESVAHRSADARTARVLSLIVETLCFLSPELWTSCGKLYAALWAVRD